MKKLFNYRSITMLVSCAIALLVNKAAGQQEYPVYPTQTFSWLVSASATETWTTSGTGADTVSIESPLNTSDGNSAEISFGAPMTGTATLSYYVDGGINGYASVLVSSASQSDINGESAYNDSWYSGSKTFGVVAGTTYYLSGGASIMDGWDDIWPGTFRATVSYPVPVTVTHKATRTASTTGSATVSAAQGKVNVGWFSAEPEPVDGGTISDLSFSISCNNPYVTLYFSDTGTQTTSDPSASVIAETVSPPSITIAPGNQTWDSGSNVTWQATIGGVQPMSCQWYFQGQPINGQTQTSLALTNLQTSNSGTYFLVASNPVGAIESSPVTLTVIYVPPPPAGSLQITCTPSVVVGAGAEWSLDAGAWHASGVTLANILVGSHAVSFRGITGWQTPSNQTVVIKTGTLSQSVGSYTFNGAGVYNGIFMMSAATPESSGMIQNLTVNNSGSFSGKIMTGNSTVSLAGTFDGFGQASNDVQRAADQGGSLTVVMGMSWDDSPPVIGGLVSGTNGGAWTANLAALPTVAGASSCASTAWILPGTPPGYGYMLITNNAGNITFSVCLADGATFSQEVPWTSTGQLPVYHSLYGGNGIVVGWISLQNGAPSGSLAWVKPPSRTNSNYTNGFADVVSIQGSPWIAPSLGTAAIDLPDGKLVISGGGLHSPLSFNVEVTDDNVLHKLAGSPPNSLTGSINWKTGLLTVQVGSGSGEQATTAVGAVLQNVGSAAGFFLARTNIGAVYLQR